MGYTLQIVIDCRDPHLLANWWAETLGWHVEAQDEAFIKRMVAEGHATEADTRVYNGATVWREGAAINSEKEKSPTTSRIYFQGVPESKTGKNRVHLDVRVGGDDPIKVRESLLARGATVLYTGNQGGHTWLTMADPEGNEFCV
ncbi:MAG: VOC family protein [Ilumatobacteraceae bacterium]